MTGEGEFLSPVEIVDKGAVRCKVQVLIDQRHALPGVAVPHPGYFAPGTAAAVAKTKSGKAAPNGVHSDRRLPEEGLAKGGLGFG